MLSTRISNKHRVASLAVEPDSQVWRMVEIELAQLLFFPTWHATEDSVSMYRRALLSDWSDVQALLDAIDKDALCRLQCLYPSKPGANGPWGMCTIKKVWRAVGEETEAEMMVFEDEEGKRYQDTTFSDERLTLKEQVWPPLDCAP